MIPLRRICISACILLCLNGWADQSDVEGRWLSGVSEGWIEVIVQGDYLIGIIAGSPTRKKSTPQRYDDKNPDPALRDRPLDGMTIMKGFRYDGAKRWTGGTIYDPNSGKTYKGTLTQIDRNTLKLRGYIGIPLFGRSDTWTRDDKEPDASH